LRNRRRRTFEAQLPEAIDVLVRSLRAGHPVSAAIRMVVRELPDPIGTEFAIAADELTYGLDLETAVHNVSRRVGQQDLALVVVAIGIQAKSGGNLAEILNSISKMIRERLRMRLKVKALSAEARFSAVVLSILPMALFGLLLVIAPHFYGDVWQVSYVKPVLAAAAAWMLIGDVVMYNMVKFEV
jgi:tight adherence protein B